MVDALIQPRIVVRQQVLLATGEAVVRGASTHCPGIRIRVAGHDGVGRRTQTEGIESRREYAFHERAFSGIGIKVTDQNDDLVSKPRGKSVQDLGKFVSLRKLETIGKWVTADFEMRVDEAVTATFEVNVNNIVAACEHDWSGGRRYREIGEIVAAKRKSHIHIGALQRDIVIRQPRVE